MAKAKTRKKNKKAVMGQKEWNWYDGKPSFKLFRFFSWLGLIGGIVAYAGILVPFIANLIPPTMQWLYWFTYIVLLGVPALSVITNPKRWFKAVRSRIPWLYEKFYKADPQERLRMHIARYQEKVEVLNSMADQLRNLFQKRNTMFKKYKKQIDLLKDEVNRLKVYITQNEHNPQLADEVRGRKRDLLQTHQKLGRLVKFTVEIKNDVEKLHKDLMTLEERASNEAHEVELLEQDYQMMIDRSKLGDQAVEARRKFEALSGSSGLGHEYEKEIDIMEIIGNSEQKLASLDVVLESVGNYDDMGYNLDEQLSMAEYQNQEYLED